MKLFYLLKVLFDRLLWGFLGISAFSALIWMLGPQLIFNGHPILGSDFNRLTIIVTFFFLWIIFQLVPQLYRSWFNAQLLNNLQNSSADYSDREVTEELLSNRFSEAMMKLKKIHFSNSGLQAKNRGWFQHFSSQYLYQLPWYMIVGAPGAGKTTALLNSGLEFPLADSIGKTALRGLGGTRNCDWWFTREAVLLDTAGRYTQQESQKARDAVEWQAFITLLKRYRTRQPINGVIMTISVADLMSDSAESRFCQASSLRQRMAELHQQLGIHFPVYVMVTKTDLLKGFMSYYASLDKSQRERIWGFSFPWESNRSSLSSLNSLFADQFRLLNRQLHENLAANMAHENDLTQRADCFLFPQEFASLQPLLAEYLAIVFAPEKGEMPWAVRGVFFTSGTQEGLPFDRIMGELTRKLQLPQISGPSIASWNSVNRQAPIPANKGQSYFIRSLLSELIFAESNLAGSDRAWEHRNRLLHWAGYTMLALALLATTLLWSISYYKNQQYLQQVENRIPAINQQAIRLTSNKAGDMLDLLRFLNSLENLPRSKSFSLQHPPVSMRGGLYRGAQIDDAAMDFYRSALKSLLLPRVAHIITQTLRNDKGEDSEFSRNALRAYQMLYQPRSYDGEFLRDWVMQNLQRTLPSSVTTQQLQQLDWHLSQLLDRQIQTSPFVKDPSLFNKKLAVNAQNSGQQMDFGTTAIYPRRLVSNAH